MPPAATKITQRRVDALTPYASNPRDITDDAVAAVAESVRRFGWTQPIEVDRDGVIINGHTRLRAAQLLGLESVPVVVSDLDDTQARAARLADNQAATLTDWDNDRLIEEIASLDDPLALTPAFDADAIDAILTGAGKPAASTPAAVGEHAAAAKTVAERRCDHCGFVF